jgi:hypothetical protein
MGCGSEQLKVARVVQLMQPEMHKPNVIINPIQHQAHRIVVKGAHAEIWREHFFCSTTGYFCRVQKNSKSAKMT